MESFLETMNYQMILVHFKYNLVLKKNPKIKRILFQMFKEYV